MSWAPKDLEDELFDDISNWTLEEPPSFFKPVTKEHIPAIIKKLDEVKKPNENKPKEVSPAFELSLIQTLRMHGIESSDDIPKSSPLSACISKNDFSDPKHPLILEEKYFTMKSDHHPCTSNQANKTRALPKKLVCDQQLYEPVKNTPKIVQEDYRPRSPKPGEDVACPRFDVDIPFWASFGNNRSRAIQSAFYIICLLLITLFVYYFLK